MINDKSSSVYYAPIDYAYARDAAVCVITVGSQSREDQQPADYLEHNLKIFKDVIPNVSKYAPNSVLLILSKPGTCLITVFKVFGISEITHIMTMSSDFSNRHFIHLTNVSIASLPRCFITFKLM